MNEFLQKVIHESLLYKRRKTEETEKFKELQHNRDLCPIVEEKCNLILNMFEKFQKIIYDIQGIRDKGTDVLIREDYDTNSSFICFQIKSDEDFYKDGLYKDLKSQITDSQSSFTKLIKYYILICCDANDKKNKDKLRMIEADLSGLPFVYVIEPENMLTFINLSERQIDVIVKREISKGDEVFTNSEDNLNILTPTEKALLFQIIYWQFFEEKVSVELTDFYESNFLNVIYNKVPDYENDWFFYDEEEDDNLYDDEEDFKLYNRSSSERIILDLDNLDNTHIKCDSLGKYKLDLKEYSDLVIHMCDGYKRYGYEDDELLYYMMDLFPSKRGFED